MIVYGFTNVCGFTHLWLENMRALHHVKAEHEKLRQTLGAGLNYAVNNSVHQ